MSTPQNIKAIHWGINLGIVIPDINLDNAKMCAPKPTNIETRSKNRFYPTKKRRIEIKTQISVMLMILKSHMNTHQMYEALAKIGMLTDHKNAVMGFASFESLVSEVRKQIQPDRKLKKQVIAELFDEGKTSEEIQGILEITRPQVYQALLKTGRITPTKRSIKDK